MVCYVDRVYLETKVAGILLVAKTDHLLFFQYVQPVTLLPARKYNINGKMTNERLQMFCSMTIFSDFHSRFQFGIDLQIAI